MKHIAHNVSIEEMTPSGHTTQCLNLHTVHRDGRRVMTPIPGLDSICQGVYQPLATYHGANGSIHTLMQQTSPGQKPCLIIESGDERSVVSPDTSASCAMARNGGFIAMTDTGPLEINLDNGEWTAVRRTSIAPEISIGTAGYAAISAGIPTMTIKDIDFDRSSPHIGSSGVKTLTDNLTDAYSRLAETAANMAMWLQPLIARFHLVDSDGNIVYSSAPIIAGNGWQCVSTLSADCSKDADTLSVPAMNLQASPYRLMLNFAPGEAQRLAGMGIKAITVSITDQLHTVDLSADAAWRIARQGTSTPILSVALPGATDSFTSRNRRRTDTLRQIMARIDNAEQQIASFDINSTDMSIEIPRPYPSAVDADIKAISNILSKAVDRKTGNNASSFLQEILPPRTFTAATAVTNGDTVVWGDITPISATAMGVSELCSEFTDTPFNGTLTATLSGGSTRIVAISGKRMPLSWGTAVSYPDPLASGLTIHLEGADGRRLHGSVALSPLADGSRAVAIEPDLSHISFVPWQGELPRPDSSVRGQRHPGALAAALLSAPTLPVAVSEICHSPIQCLTAASRSHSSWDFSRCHIYAFSNASIHAVTVNVSRRAISASAIDSRGIDRPQAVAVTPSGVMALHGGQLIRLTASRADTILPESPFAELAWDNTSQRLFMLDPDGRVFVRSETSHYAELSSPANFNHIYTVGNSVYLADTDELYRPSTGADADAASLRPVLWQADVNIPIHSRIEAIEIGMSASSFSGNISILSQNATAAIPHHLLDMKISGKVAAPIIRRVIAPPRPYVSIRLDGMVSLDFELHHITLKLFTK